MKILVWVLIVITLNFGATIESKKWKKGGTFSEYLDQYAITKELLDKISSDDQKYLSEIPCGVRYYELKDKKDRLLQSLIPLNEELQIHLFRESDGYGFDIIPVEYLEEEHFAEVNITTNPYIDTQKTIKNKNVAKRISIALEGNINPKKIQPSDSLSFVYAQKNRLDKHFAPPTIKAIKLNFEGKEKILLVDEEGNGVEEAKGSYYTQEGDYQQKIKRESVIKKAGFGMPLRHVRITSLFSYRRWHPILNHYRPHHGTDFGARKGTPLLAINDGRVTYSGGMGSYGNVVKIRHNQGYESLYAHLSRTGVHTGKSVSKGEVIGYVGNTGRSTGPHLHLGLQKNGRWIDPLKVLNVSSTHRKIEYETVTIKGAKEYKDRLLYYLGHSQDRLANNN